MNPKISTLIKFTALNFIVLTLLAVLGFSGTKPASAYYYVNNFSSVSSLPDCTPPGGCFTAYSQCWNSAAVGSTDCGAACDGGDAWKHYQSSLSCKLIDVFLNICLPVFTLNSNTCSIGDKYDSSNPPVMDAGYCSCNAGGPYKTCCNGSTPVNANHYPLDPYPPDEADCGGYSTLYCGFGGYPSCGAQTCQAAFPPPPQANLVTTNSWGNGTFYEGANVTFSATVQNIGTANAGSFDTQFLVCTDATCSTIVATLGNTTTSSLGVNATTTLTSYYPWVNIPRGNYSLRVWADINNQVPESNEWDNGNWHSICVEGKPDSPSLISPSNYSNGNSINPTLYWTFGNYNNTCAGAMGYQIRFGTSPIFGPPTSIPYTNLITGTYNPGTLLNNTTYYWQVIKCNDLSCNIGPVWSFTTAAAAPTPTPTPTPTPIGAINLGVTAPICPGPLIRLDWTTTTSETSFNILKDGIAITSVAGTTTTWTSGPETPGQNHDWRVQGNSTGTFSNIKNVTTLACPTPTPTPGGPTSTPTPTPTPTFTISGTVYIDTNQNGSQDNGEVNYTASTLTILRTGGSTTTNSGNYSFTNLTPGTYFISLSVPSSYAISPGNPASVSRIVGPNTIANFGIIPAGPTSTPTPTPPPPPTYFISGNVFVDDGAGAAIGGIAKDGIKNGTEANYTGGTTTVEVRSGRCSGVLVGSSSSGTGVYSVSGIPAGSYVVCYIPPLPSGYQIINPTTGPPPFFSVSVGPSSNNIYNFAIAPYGPWIQSTGTDVRLDNGYNYYIPPSATCGSYASLNGGGLTNGIIFTGNTNASFGGGQAGQYKNWIVGGSSAQNQELFIPTKGNVIRTSYNYINAQIKQAGPTATDLSTKCTLTSCNLSNIPPASFPNGLYSAGGNLTLNANGAPASFTFQGGKNYVIIVNGDLTINTQIHVPKGSTATFIVSGNIIVNPTVGNVIGDFTTTTPQIEGFYSTDKDFRTGTGSLRLNIAGSVIVDAAKTSPAGIFQFQRDLSAGNAQCPAFSIQERPDFMLNAPDIIKYQNTIYQEVAP